MEEFWEQAFKCYLSLNVNLFRFCGIISKYTEVSNNAAKLSFILVSYIHVIKNKVKNLRHVLWH